MEDMLAFQEVGQLARVYHLGFATLVCVSGVINIGRYGLPNAANRLEIFCDSAIVGFDTSGCAGPKVQTVEQLTGRRALAETENE